MKKVLLIIVLYALFPTWCMSESLKIDVYRAKNLENKLNYRDSVRAFKCLANGINLTTTSRFLNVMTELYGDSITNSFYNEKKHVRIHILINNSTRECILTIRPINKDSDLCFYNFIKNHLPEMVRAYCIKYGNFVTFDSTVNDCEEIVFGLMSLWVYNENLRTLEQILSHDKDFEFEPHVFNRYKLIKKSVHIDRIVLIDYDDYYLMVRQVMTGKTSY